MLSHLAIGLAVLSSLLYHVFIKLTPTDVDPVVSLIGTYATATAVCIALVPLFRRQQSWRLSLKQLNWASYALAASLVGLEMGFLLAYRAGWRISVAAIAVNVSATMLLVPVGRLLFDEELTPINVAGVLVAAIGLVLMNLPRRG